MITLNYEPNFFCNHMFSMRPDPGIMNPALVAMVRELRPRVVAVIAEGMNLVLNVSEPISLEHPRANYPLMF